MIGYYDNPTPKVDLKLERITEMVDNMNNEELAYELTNYGIIGRAHQIVFDCELPLPRLFLMENLVYNSDLEKLLSFIQDETLDKIKEMFVDFLYWRDDE